MSAGTPNGPAGEADPVAAYKALLRTLIDRRPSGTRQKLAAALGTHKSFVSQITNPNLRVPLPAQHIPTLFSVCHFAPEEQRRFLDLYARAHPAQSGALEELAGLERNVVRIALPEFADPNLNREVADAIREAAERIIRIAQHADGKSGQGGTR